METSRPSSQVSFTSGVFQGRSTSGTVSPTLLEPKRADNSFLSLDHAIRTAIVKDSGLWSMVQHMDEQNQIITIIDTTATFLRQTEKWMEKYLYDLPKNSSKDAFNVALRYHTAMNELLDEYEGDFRKLLYNGRYAQPTALILIHMSLFLFDEHELLQTFTGLMDVKKLEMYQRNAEILKRAKTAFDLKINPQHGGLKRSRSISS